MSILKKRFIVAVCACAVAVAGASLTALAAESNDDDIDIAGESESIGDFNSGDDSIQESYEQLVDNLEEVILEPDEGENLDEDTISTEENLGPDNTGSDEFSVSGDNSDIITYNIYSAAEGDVSVAAAYDVYYGSISTTYVEYMRGYLSKLRSKEHYVGARVGQYDYIFAYGEELNFDGEFYGDGITVVKWNTSSQDGTFSFVVDDNFSLNPGHYLVYSDLSIVYPALATSSDMTLRQLLILCTVSCLVVTMANMYQVRKIRRINSA